MRKCPSLPHTHTHTHTHTHKQGLFRQSIARGTWHSLHGLRFGYCLGDSFHNRSLLARRMPLDEPTAVGEDDDIDRRQKFYCAALLATRPFHAGVASWQWIKRHLLLPASRTSVERARDHQRRTVARAAHRTSRGAERGAVRHRHRGGSAQRTEQPN